MIESGEKKFIQEHAYVPEHIPGYVQSISGREPFLLEDYLCYFGGGILLFVGYPLKNPFDDQQREETLEQAVRRFKPAQVTLLGRAVSREGQTSPLDAYYRMDLSDVRIPCKVRNMIHRAARELTVEKGREFGKEHRDLIAAFLRSHSVEEETRFIFERIPAYAASGSSLFFFNARNAAGDLVCFDLAEFGARHWAFYLFNIPSRTNYVPGASDLLLKEIIHEARTLGKSYLNLGLGIHPGLVSFKRKWGGVPFLPHQFVVYRLSPPSFLDSLLRGFRTC